MRHFDVIVIGGGAVGCAIVYTLGKQTLNIALLEKNPDVAMGTSGKNSAVAHAGFNNRPGSLMAKYCVEGNKRFEEICKKLDVPYKRTGKLVVGFNDEDMAIIDSKIADGQKNGSVGLSRINQQEMKKLEPEVSGVGALLSSNTAVFDPFLYTINLCEAALQNGASFFMNNEVTSNISAIYL
jgi:glycerol-3-phosphate dehydrogenase